MANLSLAEGYAEALLVLARARHETATVEAELRVISQLLKRDSRFLRALRDPEIPEDRRAERVAQALEEVAGELVTGHLVAMTQHGNGRLIGETIERYLDTVAAAADTITAEVHAVVPLDDNQRARLEQALTRRFGRPVRVQTFVDPSVLGGLLIRVGNELVDASVRARLVEVRKAMQRDVAGLAGLRG
ncbi:MAG: ATP synthase F1 subunit delta [Candidatus Eisenbacteria bacterium]|nr:ATP synthase F1 subunit delta [Candidatus Eisenbacteria bacterium]